MTRSKRNLSATAGATVMAAAVLAAGCATAPAPWSGEPGWRLVWSDEFDYQGPPDPAKWAYDVGDGSAINLPGWGNNELQFYTEGEPANVRVSGGVLTIEARREPREGREYTSARLVTRGKADWTYGRFEVRAKLPAGRGTWPAIWMLPTDWSYGNGSWPDNGEIDIMEHVGYAPGKTHSAVHTHRYNWANENLPGGHVDVPDCESAFHVYSMNWSADRIVTYVDDRMVLTFENDGSGWKGWPFDKAYHLLINIAVGGNWGGQEGVDVSVFPTRMEVDWVRVFARE